MNDSEIERAINAAHDERAPSFAATLARKPRATTWLLLPAAAALAALVVAIRPAAPITPPPTAAIDTAALTTTSLRTPLDGLLDVPNADLLAGVPTFNNGALP